MNTSRIFSTISLVLLSVVLSACEDPGSIDDSAASATIDDSPPASTLLAALHNDVMSESAFGSWRCHSALTEVPVAYVFPQQSPDQGEYIAMHPVNGFDASYEVTASSEDSLQLHYRDGDVQESISDVTFDGPDQWVAFSTTDGALACERFAVSSSAP